MDFLSEAIQRHQIRLAIPASDQALALFERFRDGLESRTRLAMAGSNAVRQVLDKWLYLELARQLDIPCPRQFGLRDMRQIPEMIRMLGFPIVLKRRGIRPIRTCRPSSFVCCMPTTSNNCEPT